MQKEIKLKTFFIVLLLLIILEVLLFLLVIPAIKRYNEKKGEEKYCGVAICTEDRTSCYAFELNEKGDTKVIWRGHCN